MRLLLALLYTGLGSWHHPVHTKSPEAQKYFDQGLILLYGFNRHESFLSFQKAAELDPNMAMAYWGIAAALGPYINMDLDPEFKIKESCDAVARGLKVPNLADTDKQWLKAAETRCPDFANPAAYIDAMRALSAAMPDDPDAKTLYAEALMIPIRWHWYANGQSAPGELEAERLLEEVIRRYPQHPGANHFYIHAAESSPTPERAIPSAQRLMGITPSAGHMVHMPGHIWLVVGDYENAAVVNERAAEVDRQYFQHHSVHTGYYMYYLHNLTFITYARGMQGRVAEGTAAAKQLQKAIAAVAKEMPDVAFMGGPATDVLLRNQQWDDVLKLPNPDVANHALAAVWRASRALAYSGKHDTPNAAAEQKAFEAEKIQVDPNAPYGNNKAADVLALLSAVVQARLSGAVEDWKKADALQDALIYDEPPPLFYPVRESLGAALLRAGDPVAAEQAFRDGLSRSPHNGRMLFGLLEALKAQHKTDAAVWVEREYKEAWQGATLIVRLEDL